MSFVTSLSGLNAATADLNVTGNNIANGQTTGFKSSRAEFADIFASSHLGVASNAIGQGVRLTNVQQQFNQGQFSFTGNTMDMGIAGEGFFRMDNNGAISYTRAGNFQVDKDGFIVNPAGHRLTGYQATEAGAITNALGHMKIDTTAGAPKATEEIRVNANLHAFSDVVSGAFDPADPESYSFSTTGTVYDSQGRSHHHSMFFTKVEDNVWRVNTRLGDQAPDPEEAFYLRFNTDGSFAGVYDADAYTPGVPADEDADPPTAAVPPVFGDPLDDWPSVAYAGGALAGTDGLNLEVRLNSMTQFGTQSAVNELTQNGYAAGQFSSLSVESNGTIFARYSNGQTKVLGQVGLATFASPQNLQQIGDNAWVESYTSGGPIMGAPESGQFGKLEAGALEMSNVDIGEQLVKMITAQRSYQANAKMISTHDSVTQELLNIRR